MTATFPLTVTLTGVDRLSGTLKKAEGSLANFGKKATATGRKLTRGLTLPVVAVGAGILHAAANFEAGMLNIQALTGETAETLAPLETQILALGASTMFSASQAAAGAGELAQAGQDLVEVSASLPSVLALAASTNIELARSAEVAVGVLKGQRFEAEQMARVTGVLASLTVNTSNKIEDLAFAFTDAGPVAAGLGIKFEETAAALGLMGNAMFKGSKGGVALRGAMKALVAPTGAAVRTLGALKIRKEDLFDAEGNLRSLTNTIRVLQTSGAGMPELFQLFGRHAGAMGVLVAGGAEKMEELQAVLEGSLGTDVEIAAIKMQGAKGAALEFLAAVEALAISIGKSGLLEWFEATTRSATAWIQNLAKTNPKLLALGTILVGVAAALGPLLVGFGFAVTGLGGIATAAGFLIPILSTVGTVLVATVIPTLWSLTAAILANPIGIAVAAFGALIVVWQKFHKDGDSVIDTLKRIGGAIRTGIGSAFQWLADKVALVTGMMPDWLVDLVKWSPIGLAVQAGGLVGDALGLSAKPEGEALGASSESAEASKREGARAGGDSTIRVQFDNVQPGTRISQDDDEIPLDLALGIALA